MFTGQDVHTVEPVAEAYLPPAHRVQSPAAVAPDVARYLPASQAVHVSAASPPPMAGPWYPALHVHAVLADEPAADDAFAPHVSQMFASSFPVVRALYLPAWHCVQSDACQTKESSHKGLHTNKEVSGLSMYL